MSSREGSVMEADAGESVRAEVRAVPCGESSNGWLEVGCGHIRYVMRVDFSLWEVL